VGADALEGAAFPQRRAIDAIRMEDSSMNRSSLAVLAVLMTLSVAAPSSHAAATKATVKKSTSAAMTPKVSIASARAVALAKVTGGTIKSEELEREHGRLIYSFDMQVAGKSGIDEVNVDAMTGKIVAFQHEGPAAEAKEKRQEKREAHAHSSAH
jgi:uncharacterized membrane protein YkoI